ncbi:hypothetical protein vseg_020950 [Gypsophila vaccaria]
MSSSSVDTNVATSDAANSFAIFDDPLFLSYSDQPTSRLINYSFNGNNLLLWKRDNYLALIAKNKEGFIDGSCKLPDKSDKRYNQWIRCDLMFMKWLLNSLDPTISESLVYVRSSKELWEELIDRYGQTNGVEIYQLKKELGQISQNHKPLVEYYSTLKRTWESIDAIDPIPVCSCKALDLCTCQLLKKIIDRENNSKLIQFLMNLNSGYDTVRTNILSMEPLPSINKALSLLQKIERQKQISDVVDILSEANAYAGLRTYDPTSTDTKKPRLDTSFGPNSEKKCTYCHHLGHLRDECFKLNACTHCGRKGHARDRCYLLRRNSGKYSRGRPFNRPGYTGYRKAAHNVEALPYSSILEETPLEDLNISTPVKSPAHSSSSGQSTSKHAIAPELMDGIMNTVMEHVYKVISDNPKSGLSASTFSGTVSSSSAFSASASMSAYDWIIDTGASDHMTSNINLLSNVSALSKPVLVALPDGAVKLVKYSGMLHLSPTITLHNVLVVPEFKHNLLSVGRLVETTNLVMILNKYSCVFQDPSSNIILGTATRHGDLYWFKFAGSQVMSSFVPRTSTFQSNNCHRHASLDVIHARLGHISLEKMQHVTHLSNTNVQPFHCETCSLSKHHVLPFYRSVSYAPSCFALIHVDLWGPYKVTASNGAKYFLTILDDHSKSTWTFLFQNKHQIPGLLRDFLAYVHTQFATKVKIVRSDNGTVCTTRMCHFVQRQRNYSSEEHSRQTTTKR